MDIFLLLIIILLLVFLITKVKQLSAIEAKVLKIEDFLRKVHFAQSQQQKQASTETTTAVETIQTRVTPINQPEIQPVVESVITANDHIPPPVKQQDADVPPLVMGGVHLEKEVIEDSIEQRLEEPVQKPVQKPIQPSVPQESWYNRFRKNNPDLEKFIGENIVSKIGVAILVIGVAFFVKFAIDKEWINEIARVGIGILCGLVVLGFAHRLHKEFKAFSSVLVGGGIAIFYFTIGIAFHQYHLFGQTTAFAIMFFITAFSVFISVIYNRQELAALSLIGGFATPFMVSTGEGNYINLFIYVLILDAGMLVLAYLRRWNLINILAYCFTMILYFSWLQTRVIGEYAAPYKGAFLFAAIFYVVFVLMNIINNIKEKRTFGAFELSILISNTFLFYGAGMQILKYDHPELQGVFSLGMAVFNLACSWLLYKKFKADAKLVYLMIGLTLTFITLTAPVQLHGNYITLFWAAEAALLIWLAQKSGIVLYRLVSVLIAFLMLGSLLMDWLFAYSGLHQMSTFQPVLNKTFITGLCSAVSFFITAFLLKKETEIVSYIGIRFNPVNYSVFLKIAGLVLLYLTGLLELIYQLDKIIYFGVTITIIVGAYHLLFFALLNILAGILRVKISVKVVYAINFINALLFVLALAYLPIIDFTENSMFLDKGYIGFVFHYISLACFVFATYKLYKAIYPDGSAIRVSPVFTTSLMSIAIVYIASVELLLHVYQFTVGPVLPGEEIAGKYEEIENTALHVFKIGFPILWGLLAFLFLFIGMKKQNKTLRVVSLILLGVTLLKLFVYDIKDASEAGKIIAFIILGVVLLIISFMYQKIKALLLDDKKETETPSTNEVPDNNQEISNE